MKKNKNKSKVKNIVKVLDQFSTMILYNAFLLTLGYLIYHFSIVSFKLNNENTMTICILISLFAMFGVMCNNYLKFMEKTK